MYQDIVIVSAVRTPFGRYCGSLKAYDYFDLGAIPMKNVLDRVKMPGTRLTKCIGAWAIPVFVKMYTPRWRPGRRS